MTESLAPATPNPPGATKQPARPRLLDVLGPGLITGASDDDPSGIATYSQAGAQFGYDLGWTLLFSWPLMCAIQEISARIGRVTGRGIAGNLRQHYPAWILYGLVSLLLVANTINLGADLGAMAAALKLVIGGPDALYIAAFAIISVLLEAFVRYSRYVSALKWITVALFAYVGVAFAVHVPWPVVLHHLVVPDLSLKPDYLTVLVALLGTTISPYLFFWQAEEEVEEASMNGKGARPLEPRSRRQASRRIRAGFAWDTWHGHGSFPTWSRYSSSSPPPPRCTRSGITNIQTSAQAAEALAPDRRPGNSCSWCSGWASSAPACSRFPCSAELCRLCGRARAFGWHVGLARRFRAGPRAFFVTIVVAVVAWSEAA